MRNEGTALPAPVCFTPTICMLHCDFKRTSSPLSTETQGKRITAEHVDTAHSFQCDLLLLKNRMQILAEKLQCTRVALQSVYFSAVFCVSIKVCLHYAMWQNATKRNSAAWQMPKIVWTSMRRCFDIVSACCGMLQIATLHENLIGKVSVSSKVCHTDICCQL